jgi:hypothetical protein
MDTIPPQEPLLDMAAFAREVVGLPAQCRGTAEAQPGGSMSTIDLANPQPGIYPGVSFAYYVKIPAMNFSTLAWAGDSMAHLRAAIDGVLVREDSDDMEWGRALHCRLLEPERYPEAVLIRGTCAAVL